MLFNSRISPFSPGFLALFAANIVLLMGEVRMGIAIYFLIKVDASYEFYPVQIRIMEDIVIICFIHNSLVLPRFSGIIGANIVVLMGKVSMGVEAYFLIKVDDNAAFYPAQTGISGGIVVIKCFIQNSLVLLRLSGFIGFK